MKMSLFQTIFLNSFHDRYYKVSHFQDKCFVFLIERMLSKIIVKISNKMYPTPIVDGTYWTLEYDNARLLNISLTHGVNNRSR